MKTNDVLKLRVLFHTPTQIARLFVDRVLKSKKLFEVSCLRRGTSCFHASAVGLSKFRMLTRWYGCWILQLWFEQHPSGSQIAPAFAATSFCGVSGGPLAMFSQHHGFARAAIFLHAPTMLRVFFHLSAQPSRCLLYCLCAAE